MPYSLSVTEGSSYNLSASGSSSSLSLSLTGPAGPSGPAGPAGSFDGMPAAITFAGDDPNVGESLVITGTLTSNGSSSLVFPTLYDSGVASGKIYYTNVASGLGVITHKIQWSTVSSKWQIFNGATVVFESSNDVVSPDLVTTWTAVSPATGTPSVGFDSIPGTAIGQLCKTPDAWWRWDGSAWEEDAAGGVTDHGALDGLDDDDHPQYLNNTRGDARYPSINYAGENPNVPTSVTVNGSLVGEFGGSITTPFTMALTGFLNDRGNYNGTPGTLFYSSGQWILNLGPYIATKTSVALSPVGLTGWTPSAGAVGQPIITGFTPTGTVIGQLCRSSTGLWRWDGSVWVEVTATASSIPRTAVLAALPSSAPLPIENGGTGVGSIATLGTFRTDMGLGTGTIGVQFGSLTGTPVAGSTGSFTTLTAQTSAAMVATFTNTLSNAFVPVFQAIAPNLTTGQSVYFGVGRNPSTNNQFSFGFEYSSNGSTSNKFNINAYGSAALFSVTAGGAVAIPGTLAVTGASTLARLKATIPVYTNDAAADADTGLLSGQLYKITGGRTVYQKP